MKAFVLGDEALASDAGRFVWLEIDTEQPENAPFRVRYGVQALPTYFIIDPRAERILARRVGGATVAQLKEFLNTGETAYGGEALGPADRAVARAESLYAAGETAAAVAAYRGALEEAGPAWTGYAATVEALLFALQMEGKARETAELAARAYPRLRMSPAAANVAASGLDAALSAASEDSAGASGLVRTMMAAAGEVVEDPHIPVVADDRSAVYPTLAAAHEALGDTAAAAAVYEAWAAFLDREAGAAARPEERTVFDSHRLSAYLMMGRPEGAVGFLQRSEADFPADYNPPSRLAVAYLRMGRLDDALAANDRALAMVYGPRKIRVLLHRVDILDAQGRSDAAARVLRDALALAESLPPGQRSERTIAALERRLAGG
jgi:tetratricopeptide (TPR) repeat protein